MPNDGSIIVTAEKWIADALAALKKVEAPDEKVFKAAEPWNYQIDPTRGGVESFVKYSPFAFVSFLPPGSSRHGDYDLAEELLFAVALGTVSKAVGVARTGDADSYGIGKLYDLAVNAIDKHHPSVEGCDELYYFDSDLVSETDKSYCMQLYFKCKFFRTQ